MPQSFAALLMKEAESVYPALDSRLLRTIDVAQVTLGESQASASGSLVAPIPSLLEPWDCRVDDPGLSPWVRRDAGPVSLSP